MFTKFTSEIVFPAQKIANQMAKNGIKKKKTLPMRIFWRCCLEGIGKHWQNLTHNDAPTLLLISSDNVKSIATLCPPFIIAFSTLSFWIFFRTILGMWSFSSAKQKKQQRCRVSKKRNPHAKWNNITQVQILEKCIYHVWMSIISSLWRGFSLAYVLLF